MSDSHQSILNLRTPGFPLTQSQSEMTLAAETERVLSVIQFSILVVKPFIFFILRVLWLGGGLCHVMRVSSMEFTTSRQGHGACIGPGRSPRKYDAGCLSCMHTRARASLPLSGDSKKAEQQQPLIPRSRAVWRTSQGIAMSETTRRSPPFRWGQTKDGRFDLHFVFS